MTEIKTETILLGAWNVMPLEAWRWFDTVSIKRLQKLTGTEIRVFTYIENQLHYQCVLGKEVAELKEKFEKLKTEEEQCAYVQRIYDDLYTEVPKLEEYLEKMEKEDFNSFSKKQIAEAMQKFADLWTAITSQVWYALFLDIWYPLPEQQIIPKQIAAEARDRVGKLHVRSNETERRLYAEAAKKIGFRTEEIQYLFPQEIIAALSNGSPVSIAEISARRRFCVTTSAEDGIYRIYSGKKAKELFDKYQPPTEGSEAKKQLSGTIARKGKVTATARVIRRDGDFKDFKEGEVLVALQTMIHYVPIMEKSSAILTEFGGLTSHAAIVSRELNKPCIVGIKNLLASINSGDMVEVDADKGIVTIIS